MNAKTVLLLITLIYTSTTWAVGVAKPDWNNFYKSWENGCNFDSNYSAFKMGLAAQNAQKKSKIVLPESLLRQVEPTIHRYENRTKSGMDQTITISIKAKKGAIYHGMMINKLGHEFGIENGISTGFIELISTDAQYKKFISTVKFKRVYLTDDGINGIPVRTEYYTQAQVLRSGNSVKIYCDVSN